VAGGSTATVNQLGLFGAAGVVLLPELVVGGEQMVVGSSAVPFPGR